MLVQQWIKIQQTSKQKSAVQAGAPRVRARLRGRQRSTEHRTASVCNRVASRMVNRAHTQQHREPLDEVSQNVGTPGDLFQKLRCPGLQEPPPRKRRGQGGLAVLLSPFAE